MGWLHRKDYTDKFFEPSSNTNYVQFVMKLWPELHKPNITLSLACRNHITFTSSSNILHKDWLN